MIRSLTALASTLVLVPLAAHGGQYDASGQSVVTPAADIMDCIIEPNRSLDISSPVEGVVARVYVDRGDVVTAGQVLMELRSEVEEAVLDLARTRAEFAERTLNRNDNVAEVMSSQENDEIITDAKVAALELQEARTRLEMKRIKSPIDGLVIEKLRAEGEFVTEEPVFSVINIDPLFVEVIAPVSAFGRTRIGTTAVVVPEAPIGGRHTATVVKVDPVIDSASGTFRIRLEIPNPDGALPSGLKCTVNFGA